TGDRHDQFGDRLKFVRGERAEILVRPALDRAVGGHLALLGRLLTVVPPGDGEFAAALVTGPRTGHGGAVSPRCLLRRPAGDRGADPEARELVVVHGEILRPGAPHRSQAETDRLA